MNSQILCACALVYNIVIFVASFSVTITPFGNNTAGEQFNLTCTVVINESESDVPFISWNSTETDETIEAKHNGTYSKVLQFDPLQASHMNVYICRVEVVDVYDKKLYDLTVQSKLNLGHAPVDVILCLFL